MQIMAEPIYTVASDSETTGEDRSASIFPEIDVGIDIGTSQCSIAVWNGSQVELLKNTRNQKIMRSYVTFKDDTPSGGVINELSQEYDMLSGAAIFNMKRLIGRVDTDPVVHASKSLPFLVQTLDIGVRPFVAALVNNVWRSTTPEEVLAIFLVELKMMAEHQLKRPIRNVVLTIPVSFSRFQLTRVERACAMAGLQVRLMPEPTAVALLYAQQQQQQAAHENMGSGSEKIALIFNMGAGYCDVAVSATGGGVSQIKALAGSPIGGEDLLQNTMKYLLPNAESIFSHRGIDEIRRMGLLRVATQDAIHKLSFQSSVQIDVNLGNGSKLCKVLSREEFEMVNSEVFEKCENLVNLCLHDARVGIEDLSDVVVVGGCSNIPKIRNLLMGKSKKKALYEGMNPLEAAVSGAALEGAVASGIADPFGSLDLLSIQATPLAIGIRADGNSFIPIIPKNTTMPARKELVFTTVKDNQSPVPRPVNQLILGDYILAALFVLNLTIQFFADQQQWNYQNYKRGKDPYEKPLPAAMLDPKSKLPLKNQTVQPYSTPDDARRGFVTKGLWAWSRHPNFACEQTTWWILYAFVPLTFLPRNLDFTHAHWSHFANYAILAPLAMNALFLPSTRYSEQVSAEKYPEYADYQKRVGMFLPIDTLLRTLYYNLIASKQDKHRVEANVWGTSHISKIKAN